MALQKLDVYHVRNIQHATIAPSSALNFIYGANASGKSALLEAIHILGRGKSFRSVSIKPIIHQHQNHLIVAAQLQQSNGRHFHLGIQLDGKTVDMRINHQATTYKSDLAYALPIQIIHPKSYELLDAGAQCRREFLDWGVFNDDKNFLDAWRNFKKALAQRNALLKTRTLAQLNAWDKELAYYGTIVNDCRLQYMQKFRSVFDVIVGRFVDIGPIDLALVPGWDTSVALQQILAQDLDRDLRHGFTHSGPQRADVKVSINNRLAKDFVSRGQLKLLVLSLKLAQIQLLVDGYQQACILIDDFAAELDCANRAKLLHYLAALPCQVFMTASELADFGDLGQIPCYKMFHMEQGCISAC